MGGVSFLLYGMIGASGIRLMVDSKIDYSKSRNLALTSVVFVTGLSGASVQIGQSSLKGMSLAATVAMVLGLIFYVLDRLHLTNDLDSPDEETEKFGELAENRSYKGKLANYDNDSRAED